MTKILHQVGHNGKWNLDSYFQNGVGDGFILTAFSMEKDKIGTSISGYKAEKYLPISMIDLQFYGSKKSKGGKLDTYDFHPIKFLEDDATQISTEESIFEAIKFQEDIGFSKIIIPVIYKEASGVDDLIEIVKHINSKIEKKNGIEYYMTIPFSDSLIHDDFNLEKVLLSITSLKIRFDGFFIVDETMLKFNQKISTDRLRYENLLKIFRVLNKENFKIICGYANWDILIFLSLIDLDYVTIGTYETLRKFTIGRFTDEGGGGKSDGWYFSEKLLNCIRASELTLLRSSQTLDLIKNENNIFSEAILKDGYSWSIHRPDVQKNYLLAVNNLIRELASEKDIEKRARLMLEKIEKAKAIYEELESKRIFLNDANSGYHLSLWESFLKSKIN